MRRHKALAQTKEWPFALIGDLGGRLKAGNIIYPPWGKPGHKALNNLYTTMMYTVGEQPGRLARLT